MYTVLWLALHGGIILVLQWHFFYFFQIFTNFITPVPCMYLESSHFTNDKTEIPGVACTVDIRISKSKGPSDTLRDILTSSYQICRIEENTSRTTKFDNWTCNLTPLVRNIYWKYCGEGRNRSSIFCYLMLDFHVKTRIIFSLRDQRLFEITEVEITRVDCIS